MDMATTVNQRLEDLREVMRREHLAAFIFPSTDPHQSEYVADHWKGREFISGFTHHLNKRDFPYNLYLTFITSLIIKILS